MEKEMGLCEAGWGLEDQETLRKGRQISEEVPLCLFEVSSVWFDGRQKEENMNYFHFPRIWFMTV